MARSEREFTADSNHGSAAAEEMWQVFSGDEDTLEAWPEEGDFVVPPADEEDGHWAA